MMRHRSHQWEPGAVRAQCSACTLFDDEPGADERCLFQKAPTGPCCSLCKGPHRFDTSVPSALWNEVIRKPGLPEYLCLTCIVEAFANAGVSVVAELYGAGFRGLPVEIRIASQPARVAAQLQDRLNTAQAAISQICDIAKKTLDGFTRPEGT